MEDGLNGPWYLQKKKTSLSQKNNVSGGSPELIEIFFTF